MTAIERPRSLTELVTSQIRDWIVEGRYELGGLLSEAKLSKELDVSRTPVREAINRLEIEGLVQTKPQRGTFVFSLEPEELAKICDVRVCLEKTALKSAFENSRFKLIESLQECINRMTAARQLNDDLEYLRQDARFHYLFFECSENRFLTDAYQTIALKMAALRNRLGKHPDHMSKSYREHVEILETLSAGNLSRAEEILEYHIGRKEGSYWTIAQLDAPAAQT